MVSMTSALSSGELACDDPCESARPRLLEWHKMGHSVVVFLFFLAVAGAKPHGSLEG